MKKYIPVQFKIVSLSNDIIATSGFDGYKGSLTPGGSGGTITEGDYEAAPLRRGFGGFRDDYSRY